MPILKFTTNINCKNCIRAVTPFLNKEQKISRWEVDITDNNKILTVEGDEITGKEVIALINKAGYTAHRMD